MILKMFSNMESTRTRAMGFKTARRKCEREDSTVNRMNSTDI